MACHLRYGRPYRRDVDERDAQGALPVALVNEAYVHKFLPGRNPIGETIRFPGWHGSAKDDRWSRQRRGVYSRAMVRQPYIHWRNALLEGRRL